MPTIIHIEIEEIPSRTVAMLQRVAQAVDDAATGDRSTLRSMVRDGAVTITRGGPLDALFGFPNRGHIDPTRAD